FFEDIKSRRKTFAVMHSRRRWRHRVIKTVAAAISAPGSWISRILMDGNEKATRLVQQNILRAVAMMNIEIEDCDAFASGITGRQSGDGDGIEITKAHDALASGMMARRTQEAEGGLAGSGRLQRQQRSANRSSCMSSDAGVGGRIRGEVVRL